MKLDANRTGCRGEAGGPYSAILAVELQNHSWRQPSGPGPLLARWSLWFGPPTAAGACGAWKPTRGEWLNSRGPGIPPYGIHSLECFPSRYDPMCDYL